MDRGAQGHTKERKQSMEKKQGERTMQGKEGRRKEGQGGTIFDCHMASQGFQRKTPNVFVNQKIF